MVGCIVVITSSCIMSSPVYGVASCKLVAECWLLVAVRAGHNSLSRICLIKSHSADAQQKAVMGNYFVIDLLSLRIESILFNRVNRVIWSEVMHLHV